MDLKRLGKRVAMGIATTGLSSCLFGCDPPPGPAECSAVGDAQDIRAGGNRHDGDLLTLLIAPPPVFSSKGAWDRASVDDIQGATLVSGSVGAQGAVIVLQLPLPHIPDGGAGPVDAGARDGGAADAAVPPDDAGVADAAVPSDDAAVPDAAVVIADAAAPHDARRAQTNLGAPVASGSFTFSGTFSKFGTPCDVRRTFTFDVFDGGTVEVSDALPLRARQSAAIALVHRDGGRVHLEARSRFLGDRRVTWSVSGGTVAATDGARLEWQLPDAPGLYQAELVIDYGDEGFALDTMTFEVA